ncbi:MAG: 6-phosphogluconolactonase [Verrucomicrobiota bacterium]
MALKIEVLADDDAVAKAAAGVIAAAAREAVAARGVFTLAVSGGKTPWAMLKDLASEEVPWSQVHVFQIDERIAPEGDPDRNLTHLHESLLGNAPIPKENIHAMPVNAEDPVEGTKEYEQVLQEICGHPPTLDMAHLGLGPDGHTASLTPNDPVLGVTDRDVALTDPVHLYQNRRRMTLTYPMINRSRQIMWLATGAAKIPMIVKLKAVDHSIPAGSISQVNALLLTDTAAAVGL